MPWHDARWVWVGRGAFDVLSANCVALPLGLDGPVRL